MTGRTAEQIEETVIKLIENEPNITEYKLSMQLLISETYLAKLLDKLLEEGKIQAHQPKKLIIKLEITQNEAQDILSMNKGQFCTVHGIDIYTKVKNAVEQQTVGRVL